MSEKEEYEKASAQANLNEKVKALQKFVKDFPKSDKKNEALEIIASIHSLLADEKIKNGEVEAGVQLFKEAITNAPNPIPEGLFANIILPIPSKLFYLGHQEEAQKIATQIWSKIEDNPKQMLGLATFYLGIESADNARMLAQRAIEIDSNMTAAYQTLGLAYRLNFDLEEAAGSYAKAVELSPDSVISKRGLAEIKRATGKVEEALVIYRELVARDANDITAQNGLILSLFDAGKREEAESLLNKSLDSNSKNLFLLVGAAYWYGANNEGAKAVDLAQRAIEISPRYVWARIALARGQMLQKAPLEAEKTLLLAQKYGNFPTLDYELATARFQAGLFEEAVRGLKKRFAIKNGSVQTYLAGRTVKEAQTFTELLSLERRASIFTPESADNAAEAEKLKRLLDLSLKLESKAAGDEEIAGAADEFIKGDDKMKTHRQIYAASRLLEAKKSLSKALEITQGAVKGVDASLDILNPSAAVLADELLETRTLAISKDEVILIPEVAAPTLSKILRGRIEELMGWTLYQQEKPVEAVVRLKRAVSILPEKSAWWRSSYWRLGLALDAAGNAKDSVDALVKSYLDGQPDRFRRAIIEGVYRKANGNTDGLDKLIGVSPFPETVAQTAETQSPRPSAVMTTQPTPIPEVKTELTPVESAKTESAPTPKTEIAAVPETTPTPEVKIKPTPAVEITPAPESPTLAIKNPTPTPQSTAKPVAEVKTETTSIPKVDTSPTPKSIYDPIVIEVGKPKSSPSPAENTEQIAKNTEKTVEDFNRPRVVVESSLENQPCLLVSQENISLLNNGGTLGVLVSLAQEGDAAKITAESSNPEDIKVTFDPDIGKQSNRAFFVIKSVSSNKGLFTVTFISACGKKEIQVKVR